MGEIQCSNCNKVVGEGFLYVEVYCDSCIEDVAHLKQIGKMNE